MFAATVEYRYQFGFNPATGQGFQQVPRLALCPPGYVAPSGSPGNLEIVPQSSLTALLIQNNGGDVALLRWGAVTVGHGLGGVFIIPPGGSVVVEPGDPGLSTGSLSYAGGPLQIAWGYLIAETGAPTR